MTADPYQVMPPLSPEEHAALKSDIGENGVLVPVVKDQHGNLLDGHHRVQIAEELDITYRCDIVQVEDENHARSLARRYNFARRHLTTAQKRALIAEEIKADPDRSNREIARQIGVDHKTVGSVRRELNGEIPHPDSKAEPPTELDLAERLVSLISKRYDDAEDADKSLWAVPLQLIDEIIAWAETDTPNMFWFGAVASKMYALEVATEAWELMAPWLVAVAKLTLQECADVRRIRNAPDWKGPSERLAEITVAVWGPEISRTMREVMLRSLDTQIVVALVECETWWPIPRPDRHPDPAEDYPHARAAEVLSVWAAAQSQRQEEAS